MKLIEELSDKERVSGHGITLKRIHKIENHYTIWQIIGENEVFMGSLVITETGIWISIRTEALIDLPKLSDIDELMVYLASYIRLRYGEL